MRKHEFVIRMMILCFVVLCSFLWQVNMSSAEGYAVLVGVGRYKNPAISVLTGPPHDVKKMDRLLRTHYRFRHVRVLLNEQATKENVTKSLVWLAKTAGPNDSAVFYFSGHGSRVNDENGDETDGLDETITPYDVSEKTSSHITDDEIGIWIKTVRSRRLTVILDSCHSGTGYKGVGAGVKYWANPAAKPFAGKTRDIDVAVRPSLQLPPREGFVFVAASAAHEFAYDAGHPTNSVMTHYLLDALHHSPTASVSQLMARIRLQIGGRYRMTPNAEGQIDRQLFFVEPEVTPPAIPADYPASACACNRNRPQLCAQLRLLNRGGKNTNQFYVGQEVRFEWYVNRLAYIVLLGVNKRGQKKVLFPDIYYRLLGRDKLRFRVNAREWFALPPGGDRSRIYFRISGESGLEYVELIATTQRQDLERLRRLGFAKSSKDIDACLRPLLNKPNVVRVRVNYRILAR